MVRGMSRRRVRDIVPPEVRRRTAEFPDPDWYAGRVREEVEDRPLLHVDEDALRQRSREATAASRSRLRQRGRQRIRHIVAKIASALHWPWRPRQLSHRSSAPR
jgi:hypothetical protein